MPLVPLHNEAELIDRISRGDQKAFALLFEGYHDGLYQYVHRATGSAEIARDVVLDVFTRVWMHRERLRSIERFTDWIFIVTRNHLIRQLRSAQSRQSKVFSLQQHTRNYIDDRMQEREYEAMMMKAIELLPPKQRQAFSMSRYQGIDNHTIARQMGITPGSVKKYLQWAQQSILRFVKSNTGLFFTFLLLSA